VCTTLVSGCLAALTVASGRWLPAGQSLALHPAVAVGLPHYICCCLPSHAATGPTPAGDRVPTATAGCPCRAALLPPRALCPGRLGPTAVVALLWLAVLAARHGHLAALLLPCTAAPLSRGPLRLIVHATVALMALSSHGLLVTMAVALVRALTRQPSNTSRRGKDLPSRTKFPFPLPP
jgi:hypothetical protein